MTLTHSSTIKIYYLSGLRFTFIGCVDIFMVAILEKGGYASFVNGIVEIDHNIASQKTDQIEHH